MERRDWSLELLDKLLYIDSLDEEEKGLHLIHWADKYLSDDFLDKIDLDTINLKMLLELFFKNIEFLKKQKIYLRHELDKNANINR